MIKRKDALVLIVVVAATICVLAVSRLLSGANFVTPPTTPAATLTLDTGAASQTPAPDSLEKETSRTQPTAVPSEAPAYLLVTVRGVPYEPIPLDQEADLVLRQKETGMENVIRITPGSVRMASSTCDNQDCVEQGTITLANRNTRILQNMIICLPNEVLLEMITADEWEAMQ